MNTKQILPLLLIGLTFGIGCVCSPAQAENILFPADAGVINVRDVGVKGDGVTDDTAALQAAISKYHSSPTGSGFHMLYFPNGTYLLSDQLTWGTGHYSVGPWLQGQSRDGVTLKLKDNLPAYNGVQNKAVIYTGDGGADNFGNLVKNLTIHTGSGNFSAVGIRYNSNNWGTLGPVKIMSGDGKGYAGVDLEYTDQIGPCLIERVEVEGFDYGAVVGHGLNSSTWENIIIRNPRVAGLKVRDNVVNMRGLKIENAPVAITNSNGWLTVLDSQFTGGKGGSAVVNNGRFYSRNLSTTGFATAIENHEGHKRSAVGPRVDEFSAHDALSLFQETGAATPAVQSLNLPIKEVPEAAYEWDSDLSNWANPMKFGAVPNDGQDDTEAFQRAIDTPGNTTLYIPKTGFEQKFTINGTLRIRGDIKRMVSFDIVNIEGQGKISIEDGTAPVVLIERVGFNSNVTIPFEHNATRTVVLSTVVSQVIHSNGTGDLFLKDIASLVRFNNPKQKIWARQLNPESGEVPCIINNGATFWVLGTKIEYGATAMETRGGGKSEMLGLHYYDVNKVDPKRVMFLIEDAQVALINIRETQFNGPENFRFAVRETQGDQTRILSKEDIAVGGINGFGLPLYLSHKSPNTVIANRP